MLVIDTVAVTDNNFIDIIILLRCQDSIASADVSS